MLLLPDLAGFHYFSKFKSKEGRGFWQRGTSSVFTVNVINLGDLKNDVVNSDTSSPHEGSITPHMGLGRHRALCDRPWHT